MTTAIVDPYPTSCAWNASWYAYSAITSVWNDGPPFVSVWMTMNVPNVDIVIERSVRAAIGRSIGRVGAQKRGQAFAPSTRAASYTSPGTVRSAPRNISIVNAVPRHTFAMITESMGA